METGATGGTGLPEAEKSNTLIYVLVFFIILALAGIGYYAFGSRTNTIMPGGASKDPNDPMNKKIPGVDKAADSKALGILTDQNFFEGISNLANTFYGIAKDAKSKKQSQQQETAPPFNYGPLTQQEAQKPGTTWGGLPYVV